MERHGFQAGRGPLRVGFQSVAQRGEPRAPPDEKANLLAVTQVLTHLRYIDLGLLTILGGKQATRKHSHRAFGFSSAARMV